MKKNKKGFILIELLIVAVFTSILFTFLYINVIPIMGSYEQKQKYDVIDLKYSLYDLRKEILSYSSEGICTSSNDMECGLWNRIKKEVDEKGFARLHTYGDYKIVNNGNSIVSVGKDKTDNYVYANPNFWIEENEEDENYEKNNLTWLLRAYHVKSLYVTRFGAGSYATGVEINNYQSIKALAKENGLVSEIEEKIRDNKYPNDFETKKLINSGKMTQEYITKMKNFTTGYEYKKEIYRLIGCIYNIDLKDTYCGTIEILRK